MKKLLSVVLALSLAVCLAVSASAEGEVEVLYTVYGQTYQSGSGVVSPDNERPIHGTVVDHIDFNRTRYNLAAPVTLWHGDSIDLMSDGTAVVTHTKGYFVVDGSTRSSYGASSGILTIAVNGFRIYTNSNTVPDAYTSYLPVLSRNQANTATYSFARGRGDNEGFLAKINGLDSLAAYREYLDAHPLQVVWPLTTPTTETVSIVGTESLAILSFFDSVTQVSNLTFQVLRQAAVTISAGQVLLAFFSLWVLNKIVGLFKTIKTGRH